MYCMFWYVTAFPQVFSGFTRDLFLSPVWHLWRRAQVAFTEFVVKAANTTESTASEDLFKNRRQKVLNDRFKRNPFRYAIFQNHNFPKQQFSIFKIRYLLLNMTDFSGGTRKLAGVVRAWRSFWRWSINVIHKEMNLARSGVRLEVSLW